MGKPKVKIDPPIIVEDARQKHRQGLIDKIRDHRKNFKDSWKDHRQGLRDSRKDHRQGLRDSRKDHQGVQSKKKDNSPVNIPDDSENLDHQQAEAVIESILKLAQKINDLESGQGNIINNITEITEVVKAEPTRRGVQSESGWSYNGPFKLERLNDTTVRVGPGYLITGETQAAVGQTDVVTAEVSGTLYVYLEAWFVTTAWNSALVISASRPDQSEKNVSGTDYPCFRLTIGSIEVSGSVLADSPDQWHTGDIHVTGRLV